MIKLFSGVAFLKTREAVLIPAIWLWPLVALVFATGMFTGCASHREERELKRIIAEPVEPPVFLTGAVASLLANNGSGFSARVLLEEPGETNKAREVTGQLLGQDGTLIFARATGDKTFVWNPNLGSGFVLSEALQGYAPISSPVQTTNIAKVAEVAGPAGERVNGHPGHEIEFVATSNDGSSARFTMWSASDLSGFPVRIRMLTDPKQRILNLLDVRLEHLSPKLFVPPDGFTKFSTPQAMAGELISRRSKLKATRAETKRDAPSPSVGPSGY
jgi:hypothetical protein